MTAPVRVQLRRTKGWRLPPNTVKVDRSTRWGNPYRIEPASLSGRWKVYGPGKDFGTVCGNNEGAALVAVRLFRRWLFTQARSEDLVPLLRGKNLACWCALDQPCHADVLLELANREVGL